MKTLGMDLGTRTLGLATSDRTGLISSPYKTIHYEDINALADEVVKLIAELKMADLVLRLPNKMNNTLGTAVERSMVFKKILEEKQPLTVNLVDERLSTVEATNVLLDFDVSRKKRKQVVDSIAASIILDTYLRMKRR